MLSEDKERSESLSEGAFSFSTSPQDTDPAPVGSSPATEAIVGEEPEESSPLRARRHGSSVPEPPTAQQAESAEEPPPPSQQQQPSSAPQMQTQQQLLSAASSPGSEGSSPASPTFPAALAGSSGGDGDGTAATATATAQQQQRRPSHVHHHHGPTPSRPLPPPPPGAPDPRRSTMPPMHGSPLDAAAEQQQQQQQPLHQDFSGLAASSSSSSSSQQQGNRCVVRTEAPDLELDEYPGGRLFAGVCSLEQLLRFLTSAVFAKDTSQVADFVLTYDYYTTANDILAGMSRLFFDETVPAETQVSQRTGLLSILRIWVELGYASVRDNPVFVQTAQNFAKEASSCLRTRIAAWALLHAIYTTQMGRREAEELLEVMKSRENGVYLKAQGHRSHFTGQEFFDWMLDVAGVARQDALFLGEQMEAEGLIKGAFKAEGLAPSAHIYFPDFVLRSQTEVAETVPILDISPVELAEQLCLREHALFKAIRLEELHANAWTKVTKETIAPNVLAMIRFSNKISYWIATEIVSNPNAKKRLEVMRRAITIASTCLQLNCFSAVAEVLGGLQHTAVRKLRNTWMALPFKYRDMLHELLRVMSPDDNSKAYREAMRTRCAALSGLGNEIPGMTGVVPHLGQYLTDITFIDTANQDLVRGGLINFRKMRMFGAVLREVRVFQRSEYPQLRFRDELQKLLARSTMCPASDDELTAMSKFIESADNQLSADPTTTTSSSTSRWNPMDRLQDILDSLPQAKK